MTALRTQLDTGISSVPDLFRAVVERNGARSALEHSGSILTYAELDRLSSRIANGLLARGGAEPIAMVAPLEPTPIVVMLGALKAGRTFVPLDPRDPPERLALVREQLGAFMVPENPLADLAAELETDPALQLDPYHPSVVYFTSGSSGLPKGTVKSHKQLALAAVAYDVGPEDRFAVIVPLSFAASIMPVFGTLLSGATACLFDPVGRGTSALADWVEEIGATVLQTSPSVLQAMAAVLEERGAVLRSPRLAIVGGETCRGEHLHVIRRVLPYAVLANQYGSSEAGFVALTTIAPGEELSDGPIPFRRIFPWHLVEIVDENGHGVTAGETGEIVVRGSDISLGYWEEPDESDERFFERDGLRSVRTGDSGRFLPDGTLEHLGRADLRVKIHGQTVDPQAVEHALRGLEGVDEAVVSAVPARDGNVRLVAHVLLEGRARLAVRDLRTSLARSVPDYMIPTAFFRVGELPRTERGKIDREALRSSALVAAPAEVEYVSPRTETERALAEVVGRVLGLERIGARDDLFELGADSLTAVELLAAVEERFGLDLALGDLIEAPTVEALAARVDEGAETLDRLVVPLHKGGAGTPFFLVAGGGGVGMVALRRLAGRLDRPAYSFVPRGFVGRAPADRTVEHTAARFVKALQSVQPSGPYLIGGYCFGALVGYEMAQQLRDAGQRVALLVLIDVATHEASYHRRVKQIAGGRGREPASRASAARRLARHVGLWIVHGAELATAGILERPAGRQSRIFFLLNLRMARRYRPRPYGGEALVLRSSSWDRVDRIDLGGRLLTGPKQLVEIAGKHTALLREPYAGTLSALLRERLAAAERKHEASRARAAP